MSLLRRWDDADFTRAGYTAMRDFGILYPETTWASSPEHMYRLLVHEMFEGANRPSGVLRDQYWAYLIDLCTYSEVRHDYASLAIALMGLAVSRMFMLRAEDQWLRPTSNR